MVHRQNNVLHVSWKSSFYKTFWRFLGSLLPYEKENQRQKLWCKLLGVRFPFTFLYKMTRLIMMIYFHLLFWRIIHLWWQGFYFLTKSIVLYFPRRIIWLGDEFKYNAIGLLDLNILASACGRVVFLSSSFAQPPLKVMSSKLIPLPSTAFKTPLHYLQLLAPSSQQTMPNRWPLVPHDPLFSYVNWEVIWWDNHLPVTLQGGLIPLAKLVQTGFKCCARIIYNVKFIRTGSSQAKGAEISMRTKEYVKKILETWLAEIMRSSSKFVFNEKPIQTLITKMRGEMYPHKKNELDLGKA